jgi:hypothetical protein
MEEFVQNSLEIFKKIPSKSTVDYVADRHSCNSWLFFKNLANCRQLVDFQKKNPTTVDLSKKNPATVDITSKVDCRLQGLPGRRGKNWAYYARIRYQVRVVRRRHLEVEDKFGSSGKLPSKHRNVAVSMFR